MPKLLGIPVTSPKKLLLPHNSQYWQNKAKKDIKTNHHPKPKPVTSRMKLTRESVISPTLVHTEMGGERPSVGKIGVKVAPWLLVNGEIAKIETILALLMP